MKAHRERAMPNTSSSVFLAIIICMSIWIVGCEEMSRRQAGGDQSATPDPERYVGVYGATAAPAVVSFEVTEDSFTLAALTELANGSSTVRHNDTNRASASAEPGSVWLVATGEITGSGPNTMTLELKTVEIDGDMLDGNELGQYTSCTITTPVDDEFARNAIGSLLSCFAVDQAVTVHDHERPSVRIVGNWAIYEPSGALYGALEIAPSEFRIEYHGAALCLATCLTEHYLIYDATIEDATMSLSFREGAFVLDGMETQLNRGNLLGYFGNLSLDYPGLRYVITQDGGQLAIGDVGGPVFFDRRRMP